MVRSALGSEPESANGPTAPPRSRPTRSTTIRHRCFEAHFLTSGIGNLPCADAEVWLVGDYGCIAKPGVFLSTTSHPQRPEHPDRNPK
jgi:hypothetical protein